MHVTVPETIKSREGGGDDVSYEYCFQYTGTSISDRQEIGARQQQALLLCCRTSEHAVRVAYHNAVTSGKQGGVTESTPPGPEFCLSPQRRPAHIQKTPLGLPCAI